LTQRATHNQSGFGSTQANYASLLDAIKAHNAAEVASFHTPGHKGTAPFPEAKAAWKLDLTELPALDQLSHPSGVLENLQQKAAELWGADSSFISLNGASGALMAAILSCANRGHKILLPTNAHRSAVNALVMSGLEPVWFEPDWQSDWQTCGAINIATFKAALETHAQDLACALVVSPTYAGIISDIYTIARACHDCKVPLIVDEAHGAHFIANTGMPASALAHGADLVIHSPHKTLSALTQTGIAHVGKDSLISREALHAAINLLQTSSPSYLLMCSLEQAIITGRDRELFGRLRSMRQSFRRQMRAVPGIKFFECPSIDDGDGVATLRHSTLDPLHVLLRVDGMDASDLYTECCQWGVFPEAVLGNGVLFLLGTGTRTYEVESLADALEHIAIEHRLSVAGSATEETLTNAQPGTLLGEYVMSPRQAYFSNCETIDLAAASGRVAAECIAPCPPGTPVVVPGVRITSAAIKLVSSMQTQVRVIVESGSRR
jgi:arginine/lysine/ornithine decarboxylase